MNETAKEIIARYRTEGFSDSTIIQRVLDGGVDESDRAIMSLKITELTALLNAN
jgi:hypothetical protein